MTVTGGISTRRESPTGSTGKLYHPWVTDAVAAPTRFQFQSLCDLYSRSKRCVHPTQPPSEVVFKFNHGASAGYTPPMVCRNFHQPPPPSLFPPLRPLLNFAPSMPPNNPKHLQIVQAGSPGFCAARVILRIAGDAVWLPLPLQLVATEANLSARILQGSHGPYKRP